MTTKAIFAVFAIFSTTDVSGTEQVDFNEPRSCWTAIIDIEDARNFQVLCIDKANANLITFFTNPTATPTICRLKGAVERAAAEGLVIQFSIGSCENGRLMAESKYQCTVASVTALSCLVDDSLRLTFKREHL